MNEGIRATYLLQPRSAVHMPLSRMSALAKFLTSDLLPHVGSKGWLSFTDLASRRRLAVEGTTCLIQGKWIDRC